MKQVCIAINCPKGGVGKSTLSKELATAYSLTEVEGQKPNICIVDANIDFGDISSMLKVPPSLGMIDWAKDIVNSPNPNQYMCSYEEVAKHLIEHPMGFKILPAASNVKENEIITYQTMKVMLQNIKNYFDIIIVDTGNNTHDFTIACFEQVSQILVVVTDESTSINCAVSLFKAFTDIGISMDKVEIILNKYAVDKSDRCFTVDDIEEVVGGIYSIVSFESSMPQINSSGIPAMMGKDTPFKKDIIKLAKKILPGINEKKIKNKGQ